MGKKKDALDIIIKQKGDCVNIFCPDCPLYKRGKTAHLPCLQERGHTANIPCLQVSMLDSADIRFKARYELAINMYIKSYGVEKLVEILL
jgi:hypothetical protein